MFRRWTFVMIAVSLLATGAGLAATKTETPEKAEKVDRSQAKRDAIDEMASMTMERLLAESAQAKRLFDKSVGYAVFDNFKVAFLVSGGGGVGEAVDRATRRKTYMKMGTAGIGVGVGGQSYNVVFLFEDQETFRRFVEKGWHADATATAALGSKGSNAEASFSHGLAVYQLTNMGVMAHVDISGTKYWKHGKLNRGIEEPEQRARR
jgi:lipid-binding SYLF domain-containing protein